MNVKLHSKFHVFKSKLNLSGSKSETNRMLLLQALYPNIILENTSNSDDSEVMQKALRTVSVPNSQFTIPTNRVIDIHHAGTAMRFLTAFFAVQENSEVIITGSLRMKQRPIKILVEALQQLGADISYIENEGFPPLRIIGKKVAKNTVSLAANVSSQYVSALLLIAPKLENGLILQLIGEITSIPYIKMTLALLNQIGVATSFKNNSIVVKPQRKILATQISIESDWSSASYFYSISALAAINSEITLSNYNEKSLQGDAVLAAIYKNFGVETFYENRCIRLVKKYHPEIKTIDINLIDSPDIAQTIVITCLGLGIGCQLRGLHTLKIKETDRLEALKIEMIKLGANLTVTNDSLTLLPTSKINSNIKIATYNDHRMAMAFTPLALLVPIEIENAEVVSKSYPDFWIDCKKMGISVSEFN